MKRKNRVISDCPFNVSSISPKSHKIATKLYLNYDKHMSFVIEIIFALS